MISVDQQNYPQKGIVESQKIDQWEELSLNAISSFFKDRRIQSDNNKEILHNIRGMFKNKLLLTSDRLKTILGIMLHNYNSFYEDIDPKPININIWIKLFTEMCVIEMGNIEDKQIQDFYNNCYEHDLDPTYVLKMQKGLGLPDFKKIDILMEWCIKNRINNKSIMQLREGKGIPNIEKMESCINAFKRKYLAIKSDINPLFEKYIKGEEMDIYEKKIWDDFTRFFSGLEVYRMNRGFYLIKSLKTEEGFDYFQRIVRNSGIKSSKDYTNRSLKKGWPSTKTLTSSPHFSKTSDGSNDWDAFLGRNNWSERIKTEEGFEEFKKVVQDVSIKSLWEYKKIFSEKGWPHFRTLTSSPHFPKTSDGNNNWNEFLVLISSWSERIKTEEGFEEFKKVVQDEGINSSSKYHNHQCRYPEKGWPTLRTLTSSPHFSKTSDGSNDWDAFLGRDNNKI